MEKFTTMTQAKKNLKGSEFYIEVYQDGDADNSYDLILNRLDDSDGETLERYEQHESEKLIKKLVRLDKNYGIIINTVDSIEY